MGFWFSKKKKLSSTQRPLRVIRARFDAASLGGENQRHWANADNLSADAAANPEVRRTLRNRSRYEVANNSYARGIITTLANDCVGTGARLQMLTEDADANRCLEIAFMDWAAEIGLAHKLRTMRMARAQDGEAFAILTINRNLSSPVKLDLRLIEADQVSSPGPQVTTTIDGIEFDPFGNPEFYYCLRNHPGGAVFHYCDDYFKVAAEAMIHWYRAERPGQSRGIPEITPALPLFAQLRRYTLAVIAAAETAANFAAVLYTDAPANGEAAALEPMDVVELERNMATTLPDGWKLGQVEAQQPATAYGEFKKEILNEIARCLNMPFNIAAGNSSGYNYASGRLDHQTYYKSIRVDQGDLALVVLDKILRSWLDEAVLIEGFLPQVFRQTNIRLPHLWFWDGHEHVDPAKEANAQATRLQNNTTTLADEYARQGKDWETQLNQRAKEIFLMQKLGLNIPQPTPQFTEEIDEQSAA